MIHAIDKMTGKRVMLGKHALSKRHKLTYQHPEDKDPSAKGHLETNKLNESDLSIPSNRVTSVSRSDLGATGPSTTNVRGGAMRTPQTGGPYMAPPKPMMKVLGGKVPKELKTDDILKEIEKSFQSFSLGKHNRKITGGMIGTI